MLLLWELPRAVKCNSPLIVIAAIHFVINRLIAQSPFVSFVSRVGFFAAAAALIFDQFHFSLSSTATMNGSNWACARSHHFMPNVYTYSLLTMSCMCHTHCCCFWWERECNQQSKINRCGVITTSWRIIDSPTTTTTTTVHLNNMTRWHSDWGLHCECEFQQVELLPVQTFTLSTLFDAKLITRH